MGQARRPRISGVIGPPLLLCAALAVALLASAPPAAAQCRPERTEADLTPAGGTVTLAGVASLGWPAGGGQARGVVERRCDPELDATFAETTAVLGPQSRLPYIVAVQVRGGAPGAIVRLSLALPVDVRGLAVRPFLRIIEGGADEAHDAFVPVNDAVRDGASMVVDMPLSAFVPVGEWREAALVLAWSRRDGPHAGVPNAGSR